MSKGLVDKGYYKQKVIDKYCGEIEMLENKHVLRVDQEDHSVVDSIKIHVVVLLCLFVSGDAQVRCVESDKKALLSFKNGLIDEHGILSSWRGNECCKWYGVKCSNTTSHVVALQLNNVDYDYGVLQGELDSVNLARCNVGPYFPKWLQTQRNLAYLNLNGTNITDEAPRWLWSMSSSLCYLRLSNNQISGMVPNLSTTIIEHMDLSYNQFRGPIPLFPVNASHIQLNGNMFSASISSLCKTPHNYLRYFDLSNNQLAGEVPNCWDKMTNLRYLNLANNGFLGEIPSSFGNLQELVALQMHGNGFSGELPFNLRLCQYLLMIDVGGNNLTGEISTWIGQLYQMQFLNFRGNKLHGRLGSIPPEICDLIDIQVLDLSINNLSSIIHDCFNNFTVLASESIVATYVDSINVGIRYGSYEKWEYEYSSFQWKGQESNNKENLKLLKLIIFQVID
ncbi:receptor-like protein EIX2 [Salvia hispanica]|uniref:receptor-like protein EIX2 n=1 Tax=Salvia hispanica TaxID=49212 RepID=UPI002009843C|nr:receptor-like protein EIX2 [Salvia hispanica]